LSKLVGYDISKVFEISDGEVERTARSEIERLSSYKKEAESLDSSTFGFDFSRLLAVPSPQYYRDILGQLKSDLRLLAKSGIKQIYSDVHPDPRDWDKVKENIERLAKGS